MLHAVVRNKSLHYRLYRGEREDNGRQVREEDEITSTFLGPLDFMDPILVYDFCIHLFGLTNLCHILPKDPPTSCKLILWPRLNGGSDRLFVEPDAQLILLWPNGKKIIIVIEFKWRAPLSGSDQLHQQWSAIQRDYDPKNAWHFFVGLDISCGINARHSQEVDPWLIDGEDHLALISWAQIRDALGKIQPSTCGLYQWATLTDLYLDLIGVKRFKGYCNIAAPFPNKDMLHSWRFNGLSHGFHGYHQLELPPPFARINSQQYYKE